MPPTQKAVLISLADNANDDGHCWPSISTICERTCFGRTAVIEAIKWLETEGYVIANRENGRHTTYLVRSNQSASRTGAPRKPVRQPDPPVRQPDGTGPDPVLDQSANRTPTVRNHQGTIKEPSLARDARPKASKRCPDDFVVTAELRQWAQSETPGVDVEFETAAMRDYAYAKAHTDWPAAWRNWMRTAYRKRGSQSRASPNRPQSAFDRNAEIAASLSGKPFRQDIIDVTPPKSSPNRMGAAHFLPLDRDVRNPSDFDEVGAD